MKKSKSGVKRARKPKQRKGCGGRIFILLFFIIVCVAIGYLKWAGMLDGIGLPFVAKEDTAQGATKEVALLNLANCSERKVTDERSAKEALMDMKNQIGFTSIDEFSEPIKSVTDVYTFYKFDNTKDEIINKLLCGYTYILFYDCDNYTMSEYQFLYDGKIENNMLYKISKCNNRGEF